MFQHKAVTCKLSNGNSEEDAQAGRSPCSDRVDVVSSGALVHDCRPDREARKALAGAAVNASA